MFAARFRENAARALLLPRRFPGRRTPLWLQRRKSADLMSAASRYPKFPMILETYRECLSDVFDLAGLTQLLEDVRMVDSNINTLNFRARHHDGINRLIFKIEHACEDFSMLNRNMNLTHQ